MPPMPTSSGFMSTAGCSVLCVFRCTPTNPTFSSLELFPNILERLLRSNKTVVEMSCVATDGDIARSYVWLPYLILRSWIVAAEHFHANYIAAAVRPQHQESPLSSLHAV
jgi:hypothetical protein